MKIEIHDVDHGGCAVITELAPREIF